MVRAMVLTGIVACVAAAFTLLRVRARQRQPAPATPGASVAAEAPGAVIQRRHHDNSGLSHFSASHRGYRQAPRIEQLKKRPR